MLLLGEVLDDPDGDPRVGERGSKLAFPESGLSLRQLEDPRADRRERRECRSAVGRAGDDSGVGLLLEARHSHHEELVQVGREELALRTRSSSGIEGSAARSRTRAL